MKYLLLAYTKEGYLSTNVPGDLFQGTFEVFNKTYFFDRHIYQDIDEDFISQCIIEGLNKKPSFLAGGKIVHIASVFLSAALSIQWNLCYIEIDDILPNIKADIWDEGFDIEYGPMLILKGLENGH